MGAFISWFGRLFVSSLSGLGFFSLFGVTDKDRNEMPFYITIGVLGTALLVLLMRKK